MTEQRWYAFPMPEIDASVRYRRIDGTTYVNIDDVIILLSDFELAVDEKDRYNIRQIKRFFRNLKHYG